MKKIVLTFLILSVGIVGCDGKSKKPNIELFQDMFQSPAYKAQDFDPDNAENGNRAMRVPPEGTVPIGYEPYLIKTADEAGQILQNPVEASREVLLNGQKQYMTYCSVCHGSLGAGDGPVASKMMLRPPSLVNDRIKNWKDGQIFHLITKGRGLMGGYESQIQNREDRWALIHYIRHLQNNTEK